MKTDRSPPRPATFTLVALGLLAALAVVALPVDASAGSRRTGAGAVSKNGAVPKGNPLTDMILDRLKISFGKANDTKPASAGLKLNGGKQPPQKR